MGAASLRAWVSAAEGLLSQHRPPSSVFPETQRVRKVYRIMCPLQEGKKKIKKTPKHSKRLTESQKSIVFLNQSIFP